MKFLRKLLLTFCVLSFVSPTLLWGQGAGKAGELVKAASEGEKVASAAVEASTSRVISQTGAAARGMRNGAGAISGATFRATTAGENVTSSTSRVSGTRGTALNGQGSRTDVGHFGAISEHVGHSRDISEDVEAAINRNRRKNTAGGTPENPAGKTRGITAGSNTPRNTADNPSDVPQLTAPNLTKQFEAAKQDRAKIVTLTPTGLTKDVYNVYPSPVKLIDRMLARFILEKYRFAGDMKSLVDGYEEFAQSVQEKLADLDVVGGKEYARSLNEAASSLVEENLPTFYELIEKISKNPALSEQFLQEVGISSNSYTVFPGTTLGDLAKLPDGGSRLLQSRLGFDKHPVVSKIRASEKQGEGLFPRPYYMDGEMVWTVEIRGSWLETIEKDGKTKYPLVRDESARVPMLVDLLKQLVGEGEGIVFTYSGGGNPDNKKAIEEYLKNEAAAGYEYKTVTTNQAGTGILVPQERLERFVQETVGEKFQFGFATENRLLWFDRNGQVQSWASTRTKERDAILTKARALLNMESALGLPVAFLNKNSVVENLDILKEQLDKQTETLLRHLDEEILKDEAPGTLQVLYSRRFGWHELSKELHAHIEFIVFKNGKPYLVINYSLAIYVEKGTFAVLQRAVVTPEEKIIDNLFEELGYDARNVVKGKYTHFDVVNEKPLPARSAVNFR